jgi:hypothetical protein
VEIMEQMRDRWANAKDNVAEEMVRQGRRVAGMLTTLIVLVAILIAVVLVKGFVR